MFHFFTNIIFDVFFNQNCNFFNFHVFIQKIKNICNHCVDFFIVTTKFDANDFVNNNTNFAKFNFEFDFCNFVDKKLSIHFFINFNEIVVRNEKINDKKIVNVDKMIHEMKIHFSFAKNIIVVNDRQIVVINAKFDNKIVNIDKNFQND